MRRLSNGGQLQSLLNVAPAFGGTGEDTWSWVLCDAPTLLYALLALGLGQEAGVQTAVAHLVNAVDEVGWRCRCGPELGRFRGPGRAADPCPIANVYALKALSLVPEYFDSPATRRGWSFADKKQPSPWLTFLALRIQARIEGYAGEAGVIQ